MSRARDMHDQFVGLLDRVELALTSNDNPADTTPIQKVRVRFYWSYMLYHPLDYNG